MLDNLKLPNETIDKAYDDGFKPTVSEVGKLVGRIPKAINAAFAPLDIWIAKQENNVARTKQLLEQNLENVEPEKIVPPEPYVAIPAIQAISYSMDSEELRIMYANLLAKSIYSDTRDLVHPAFTEIIKNLSPLDCRVFNAIMESPAQEVACFEIRYGEAINSSYYVAYPYVTEFAFAPIDNICTSINNLERNNLIKPKDFHYDDDDLYENIRKTSSYQSIISKLEQSSDSDKPFPCKMSIKSTSLGKMFYQVCCVGIN